MSRMNRFCHGASLNRFPCPIPLGTVRVSINLITRAARRFPASVRFTCAEAADEAGELRLGTAVGSAGGNTSPGGWGESKLDGISEHVAGGFVGGAHQRVLNRVAARGLDHQAAGEQIALGHFRK